MWCFREFCFLVLLCSAFAFRYFAKQFQCLLSFHSSHVAVFTGDKTSYLWKMKNNFGDGTKSVLFGTRSLKSVLSYGGTDWLCQAKAEKAARSFLKCGFEKRVLNKGWNWILNKDLGVHGRKIHHWCLREQSLAHKAFEISGVTECWHRALSFYYKNLFLGCFEQKEAQNCAKIVFQLQRCLLPMGGILHKAAAASSGCPSHTSVGKGTK